MIFELYFDDLTERAQKELLELAGVERPEDMNWDVVPVSTFEVYAEDEDEENEEEY